MRSTLASEGPSRSPQPAPRPVLAAAAAIVAASVFASACATSIPVSTPTSTSPPPPTSTPLPSPTPTPSAADHLAVGQAAAFNGDWDGALSAFDRAAAADGAAATQAELLRAVVLFEVRPAGRGADRTGFLPDRTPAGAGSGSAHLIRALARRDLADPAGSVEDFNSYLALRPGQIDAYVQEWAGDTLWSAGQPRAAAERYLACRGIRSPWREPRGALQRGPCASRSRRSVRGDPDLRCHLPVDGRPGGAGCGQLVCGAGPRSVGRTGCRVHAIPGIGQQLPRGAGNLPGSGSIGERRCPGERFSKRPDRSQRRGVRTGRGGLRPGDRIPTEQPRLLLEGASSTRRRQPGGTLADLAQVYAGFAEAPERTDAWLLAAEIAWFDLGDPRQAIGLYQQFVAADPANPKAPEALFSAGRAAELSGDLPGSACAVPERRRWLSGQCDRQRRRLPSRAGAVSPRRPGRLDEHIPPGWRTGSNRGRPCGSRVLDREDSGSAREPGGGAPGLVERGCQRSHRLLFRAGRRRPGRAQGLR